MASSVRIPLFIALVTIVACNDPVDPARPPSRGDLNGVWRCYRANLFSVSPLTGTARWRLGSCAEYILVTSPSRRDSIDTTSFAITELDRVEREVEFRPGHLVYDSAASFLTVYYPDRDSAVYDVMAGFLTNHIDGEDLTGDGVPDSLRLTFCRHLFSCP